jgi:spore cortex formation protein SpoVR/YcgB (stage V sporulation)
MTKVMNEGWATYWHSTLMPRHFVEATEIIDDDRVLFSVAGDQPRQQTIHADLPTPAHQVM